MHQSRKPRRPWLRRPRWWEIATAAALLAMPVVIVLVRDLPARTPACTRSAELVPSCGVLLGITPPDPSLASLAAVEKTLGHRFALVHTFHDIDDAVPSAYERALAARGTVLHISIDPRVYGEALGTITWAAIAAGEYDDPLTRDAEGIASLHRRVFVSFDHEPDQGAKAAEGSPADFVAAWRHVHQLFEHAGATNVVWVWVVTGWAGSAGTALQMWPGNAYVDWISWEAYDNRGCNNGGSTAPTGFARAALTFEHWLRAHGPAVGMDLDKPMMISEAGTAVRPGAALDTGWFAQMQRVLRHNRQIKAITWWDHTGSNPGCDFTFTTTPALAAAASSAAKLPWFGH
jgi:hypothetical protein